MHISSFRVRPWHSALSLLPALVYSRSALAVGPRHAVHVGWLVWYVEVTW